MWPFPTITDTTPANPTTTHPPSPPPPCAARVVVDVRPSLTSDTRYHVSPTHLDTEGDVPTIENIILDMDVMEPTMTRTLQRMRCAVVVKGRNMEMESPRVWTYSAGERRLWISLFEWRHDSGVFVDITTCRFYSEFDVLCLWRRIHVG